MINPIHQIAKLITEHPDIINHNIILESLESKIKKLLTKISNQLPHEINIDEITQFATQQRFKELGISRWIAKQVAFNPNLRVDWSLLTDYIAHLKFRDNNKYKALFKSKIQEVIEDTEEWHSSANDDKAMIDNEPIIAEFSNGYRIVQLITKEHCKVEGELMDNCVKNYDPKESDLYSLRSPDGKPKVTIDILKDGRINELKGRQNKPPVKKYADLVIPWVNSILRDPKRLFDDSKVNFTDTGFRDYFGSLSDEGLLLRFAKSKDANIRIKVAGNSNTPIDVLRYLSKDEHREVRAIVAINSNTPADILRSLSKDDYWETRTEVARNPNTPIDILRALSKDNCLEVRIEVTGNSSTPIDILRLLSKDDHYYVRDSIASNPNTPVDILRPLSKDDHRNVRSGVAGNPNTPIDILRSLSKGDHWNFRSGVAGNPNTPIDILRLLSKDEDWGVRRKVAENLNTPIDALRHLSKDEDEGVRQDAIKTLEKLEN